MMLASTTTLQRNTASIKREILNKLAVVICCPSAGGSALGTDRRT